MKIEKLELPINRTNNKNLKNTEGIYLLFDENLNLLYIGKTKTLRIRIWQHTSKNNSSSFENTQKLSKSTSPIPRGLVKHYAIINGTNDFENSLIEVVLIKCLNPPFNNHTNQTLTDYIQKRGIDSHIDDK